jgi:hypothetical protein
MYKKYTNIFYCTTNFDFGLKIYHLAPLGQTRVIDTEDADGPDFESGKRC